MEGLSEIWGEALLSLERENTSDFERQKAIVKAKNNTQAVDENDVTYLKMMESNICSRIQESVTSEASI